MPIRRVDTTEIEYNSGNNTFTMPTNRGSDGYVLMRDDTVGTGGTGWRVLTPSVSSISPTNIEESATTQTIVITGSDFDGTASGALIDNNGSTKTPTTSTRNSATQITITYSGSDLLADTVPQPLDVKVTQGATSLSNTLANALTIDAKPAWSSPNAGALSGDYIEDAAITQVNFVATDPEGQTPTYSVTSGALPTGLTLSSAGALTGTPNVNDTYNSSGVTHNFTVTANDTTGNTADRAFSILRKWKDGSTSTQAAPSAKAIRDLGISTNGNYYISNAWTGGSARESYCEFDFDFRGLGTNYQLQKFDPGYMSGYLSGSNGPETTSWSNPSSNINDNTSYTKQASAQGNNGGSGELKTDVAMSTLGQFFLRIDHDEVSRGDTSNACQEMGPVFDTDHSNSSYNTSASASDSNNYYHHFDTIPNNWGDYLSIGYLMPSNAGTSAFAISTISCGHGDVNASSIAQARTRLGGSSDSNAVSASRNTTYSVATSATFGMKAVGWADSGTNTARFMFWVAAAV